MAAQRRPAGSPPADEKTTMVIDLQVNGAGYAFKGQGTCHHVAKGSIYDTPAERWSVRQSDSGRSVALTLWRPLKGAGDMVNLSITAGGKSHDVNTVKSPQAAKSTGSGNVRLAGKGAGGVFTLDATAASGAKITGTISCEKFTVPAIVAGD
jgi:hypothetical protein